MSRQVPANQELPESLSLSRKSHLVLEPSFLPILRFRQSGQWPPGGAKFQLELDRVVLHSQTHRTPNPLAVFTRVQSVSLSLQHHLPPTYHIMREFYRTLISADWKSAIILSLGITEKEVNWIDGTCVVNFKLHICLSLVKLSTSYRTCVLNSCQLQCEKRVFSIIPPCNKLRKKKLKDFLMVTMTLWKKRKVQYLSNIPE